ncbi:hypothetical protein CO731_04881 [Aminobacter sp. MSH1]|uniref:hypothetical protein n=1 Tax=Aminobacter sp. MSH1 TaxID=374606 RepID=UPI000D33E274|nr:hypothetical protein [Aminobacter sp. MSH1]AWC25386.1 hypothetical protein CO731_04881 [Aminobacter sp. MSH1]
MTRPRTKDKVIAYHRSHPTATAVQAAAALQLEVNYVRNVGHREGFAFQDGRGSVVYVPKTISKRLDGPALERGLTVNELSNKLLSIIAMDGLVGAILDES